VVKADLGTKRVCPSCGARFYDLSKRPIECPKCAYAFEPEALYKQRRPRQPEAAETGNTVEAEEEEDETVENEDEDAIVEKVEGEPELDAGDEDAEEDTDTVEPGDPDSGMSVVESEDAALEDLDDEDVEDDEDDGLLEEVEEDEDDVSGIIDADIEKDER
jgi:TIGR02300 family protein